jgi:phage-related protein (TIGR01555 family)
MGRRRRKKVLVPEVVQNSNAVAAIPNRQQNNFASSMQNWGAVFPQGYPRSAQISEPGSIFHNLRWWLVSNLRQMLSEAYVELGIIQNVVDVPVDDALRGGIEISSKQIDEEQLAQLSAFIDEQGDLETAGFGAKWNRLFGGGAIVVFTDQDPLTPIDVDAITEDEDVEFRAVDMWELFYDYQAVGQYEDALQSEEFEFYDYYGERIHKSRVIPLKGIMAPSFIRPRLRGWGVSVVETLVRSVNQYLKGSDLTYEVLDEFKVDVYKINNLVASNFAPGGAESGAVSDRVEMVNWQKNFQNAIVLDGEDEWDHKQLSFAGLAEAQEGIRMQLASDVRMPMTKLFGMSAQGFNSGEDDIEVYNGMVESSIRGKLKHPILQMVKIRCQQLFGFVPDDLTVAFKPLRVLSSEQEENVKTQKFNRLIQARQAGEISARTFLDACNRANLFDVKVDTNRELLGLDPGEGQDDTREATKFSPRSGKDVKDDNDSGPAQRDRKGAKGLSLANAKNRRISNSKDRRRGGQDDPLPPQFLPKAFTKGDRIRRALNSLGFDRASYAADGGDSWIDSRRKEFFEEPVGVDQTLWGRARIRSQEVFGAIRWQFVAWMYRKLGGRFAA